MSVTVEGFLGRTIEIPEDLLYDDREHLWLKKDSEGRWAVGLTEPAILMAGTIRQIELLVEDGQEVAEGETVVLALTAKLKYIACPLAGRLVYPADTEGIADKIGDRPYDTPMFFLESEAPTSRLLDAAGFGRALADSEGARNPGGHTGGVSPTCKAVYMGIRDQTIEDES